MITQENLKSVLKYDKNTGKFIRIKKTSNAIKIGDVAGCITAHGYIMISIFGTQVQAHKLAWLYCYGRWPEKNIDHINHNSSDNRINNLRLADHNENGKNLSMRSRNKTGVTGVCYDQSRDKWQATITVNRKSKALGRFIYFIQAMAARFNAEIKYGFHYNHGK